MMPGPQIVYKCPSCEKLVQENSLKSGNTFGATFYSDGKYAAPMMSDILQFTKCRKCSTFYWLDKPNELIRYELGQNHPLEHVKTPQSLRIEDFHEALNQHVPRTYREIIYVRQRLMWLYNDSIRFSAHPEDQVIKDYRHYDNLKALLGYLFINKPTHVKIAAEIHRNLGEFDKSLALLDAIEDEEFEATKTKLIKACKDGIRNVIPI